MPQIINTNITSLNSQRHLNSTQNALSQAMERLSSGKRINSAKDDAAGLGISSRMTTQVNGMNQAIRNARDGISLGQTAEGALSTSADMLQRIRTLAVQSSNATNASLDRQAIQDEVGQLAAELNRIAETTSFNGQKLLNGTMGTQHFQVGANAGELISANGMNFLTHIYGNNRVQGGGSIATVSGAAGAFDAAPTVEYSMGEATINGYLGTAKVAAEADATAVTARDYAQSINDLTAKTGVTASAKTTANFSVATTDGTKAYAFLLKSDNADPVTISFSVDSNDADGYAAAINAINSQSAKTGVTAEYDQEKGGIKLTNATGGDIKMANNLLTADTAAGSLQAYGHDGNLIASAGNLVAATTANTEIITGTIKGTVTMDSDYSFSVSTATAATAVQAFSVQNGANAPAATTAQAGASKLNAVSTLDVTTFEGAQLAIAIADAGINLINKEMARYGALQARFEATIENLEVNAENTTNARSRIEDADYAQETANLSRASILQQAGTAMLAQANQLPQTVLSLIG